MNQQYLNCFQKITNPQNYDNTSQVNQNLIQTSSYTGYVMNPQQVYTFTQMPYMVNQPTSGIIYYQQPLVIYNPLISGYPSIQQSYLFQHPHSNFISDNKLQDRNDLSYQGQYDKNTQKVEIQLNNAEEHCHEFKTQSNIPQSMNITEFSVKQDKKNLISENNLIINQIPDIKKQEDNFQSFSSDYIVQDNTQKFQEQDKNIKQEETRVTSYDKKFKEQQQNFQIQRENIVDIQDHKENLIDIKRSGQINKFDSIRSENQNKCLKNFNLSQEEITFLEQFSKINIQNAFKNILKGFSSYINKNKSQIYIYEYSQSQTSAETQQIKQVEDEEKELREIRIIKNPTIQERKAFIQKFNKFIKNKKYNNTSIRQIIQNRLYSTVFKDYIINNSFDWMSKSKFQNKEDVSIVLKFFEMSCMNQNLLVFLNKTNAKLILDSISS